MTGETTTLTRVAVVGIFVILLFGTLYVAREILLPIVLAFLLATTLNPVVRHLHRRGVPPPATALALVLVLGLGTASGIYYLSGPAMQWIEAAPELGQQLQEKLITLRRPVAAVAEASKTAEDIAEPPGAEVQKVEVQQQSLVAWAATGTVQLLGMAGFTFVLLLFLLAAGGTLHDKIIRVLPTLSDKKRALRLVYDVESEVSQYLLTITLINSVLGLVIGVGMWLAEMPNPGLWGVAAALLNFIPFLGAAIGVATVALVALVSLDTLAQAVLPPVIYLTCTVIEGSIITPYIVGRRLALNAPAILIALALWSWLWGIVGALIAVPLLVATKAFCDHFDELQAWGEFLSARAPAPLSDDESRNGT